MNKSDRVYLMVIFRWGHKLGIACTVGFADRMMQCWYKNREVARGCLTQAPNPAEGEVLAATLVSAQHWIKTATYASNIEYEDKEEGSFCRECFAWEEVIAMYIYQPQMAEGEEWKYGGSQ